MLGSYLAPVFEGMLDVPAQLLEAPVGLNCHFDNDDCAEPQAEQGSASAMHGPPGLGFDHPSVP